MIIQNDLLPQNLLRAEIIRLNEIGVETGDLSLRLERSVEAGDLARRQEDFWRQLENLSRTSEALSEPSDWQAVQQAFQPKVDNQLKMFDRGDLHDRVYGAWTARCIGCTLGKPVEGWPGPKIEAYLNSVNAYPLSSYFPVRRPFLDGLNLNRNYPETTLGNINYMARDDDIDYTILGLHILETYGAGFTPEDIAVASISNLPFNLVYTAEAIAYRNIVNGLLPPASAKFRNPFQEYIGAQIRADIWGYINPGDPEKAAEFAFRDAAYSHTGNGIYGEMWAAASIATAFVEDDPLRIILSGLNYIPASSRLADAIRTTIDWVNETSDWQKICEHIESNYGSYHTVHVIPNTCYIVMGLLLGAGDFQRSICTTVMAGRDTDCTGATVGSIIGAMQGYDALPDKWKAPLQDRVKSLIPGFQDMKISELALRTMKMIHE